MNPEILQQVIQLVSNQTGVETSRLTAETRLGEDLGVDGDDAADLLAKFADRFQVDLTGFEFDRHFGPEAGWSPCRVFTDGEDMTPVTIGDLAAAAERGAWKSAG